MSEEQRQAEEVALRQYEESVAAQRWADQQAFEQAVQEALDRQAQRQYKDN